MGNAVGCSSSGERLLTAARDGDVVEVRMLLALSPGLARYSTFAGLNSPLHFAAAKGHAEIVMLLLESGAEVNSRNYCGQTALMQACRYGHWEVVQTLLLFRSNVTRTDYLSGRTALHFAAAEGHVRCIRLLVADFIPSSPYEVTTAPVNGEKGSGKSNCSNSSSEHKNDKGALLKFINRPSDGGITSLHMAALNGHFDCVHLLLDLHINISAVTFHYGASVNLIGAGSTPLHYAACGGNLKCCQILLARGASRLTLNCNGWLPLDVARIWGRHWLEPLLSPNSKLSIPTFPPSSYLSLPLMSILNIARECKLQSPTAAFDDSDLCAVCLERACTVSAEGCGHELCVKCALYLCSTINIKSDPDGPSGSVPCPLCRSGVVSFVKLPSTPAKELKPNLVLGLCNPCMRYSHDVDKPETSGMSELKDSTAGDPPDRTCLLPCSTSHSAVIPTCTSTDGPCLSTDPQGEAPDPSQSAPDELEKSAEERVEKTSCSSMFWNGRSSHREHQCNSEINA